MWREKTAQIKEKYGEKLLTAAGFLVIGVLAFEAGLLWKNLALVKPMVIHEPSVIPEAKAVEKANTLASPSASNPEARIPSESALPVSDCAFVGSKNSNKYHDPSSRCAKQIKPTNRVCFKDAADAQARGYVPGCLIP